MFSPIPALMIMNSAAVIAANNQREYEAEQLQKRHRAKKAKIKVKVKKKSKKVHKVKFNKCNKRKNKRR